MTDDFQRVEFFILKNWLANSARQLLSTIIRSVLREKRCVKSIKSKYFKIICLGILNCPFDNIVGRVKLRGY